MLVEMQIDAAIWKSLALKNKKVKHKFTTQPSNSTPSYLPQRSEDICSHKDLCMNVISSMIFNSKEVEAIQTSTW